MLWRIWTTGSIRGRQSRPTDAEGAQRVSREAASQSPAEYQIAAALERKCPTDGRPDLSHVNGILNTVCGRVATDIQKAIAEPEIIEVA
jgi:hypothetical protein